MNRDAHGRALIEVIVIGSLLLAPLIWLVTALAALHAGALATTAAAREAGFDAARAVDTRNASAAVDRAVHRALVDHGLEPGRARVRWSAAPRLPRGGRVEVTVSYPVRVLAAPFLGSVGRPVVWITARHAARIDPFRSQPR